MIFLFGTILIVALVVVACMLIWAMIVHNQTIEDLFEDYRTEMLRLQGLNTPKEHQDGTERRTAETTKQKDHHDH